VEVIDAGDTTGDFWVVHRRPTRNIHLPVKLGLVALGKVEFLAVVAGITEWAVWPPFSRRVVVFGILILVRGRCGLLRAVFTW